jgi:hypothetical protein
MCDLVDGTFRKKKQKFDNHPQVPILKNGRDLSEFLLVHQLLLSSKLYLTCRFSISSISKQLLRSIVKRKNMRKRRTSLVIGTDCPFTAILIYFIGYLVGDDEPVSDDETDAASLPGLPHVQAQDLEVEARRVVARARRNTQSDYSTADGISLPFRVPRENDPTIWSVRVKVGRSALSLGKY